MSESINYMYIGPTVAKLGLKKSTLVIGSEPIPQLRSLIELHPIVSCLFVPTSQVAVARKKLAVIGSLEDMASKFIVEHTRDKQEKRKQ